MKSQADNIGSEISVEEKKMIKKKVIGHNYKISRRFQC